MRTILTLTAAALLLAACGVDGEPEAPTRTQTTTPEPGIAITGRAEVGIARRR